MTQGKEIVYVNGCSFTAGADLADNLLPDYPPERSLNDYLNKFDLDTHLNYQKWRSVFYDDPSYSHLITASIERRWTTQLSKITGAAIINKSISGSDNFSIFARSCNDIENLKASGHIVKKVIIQITGFTRYSYLRHRDSSTDPKYTPDLKNFSKLELNDGFFLRHLMAIQLGAAYITEKENDFLKRSLYDEAIYDDQSPAIKLVWYLLQLKMYKDAVRGVAGIEPIILDSIFTKQYLHCTDTEQLLDDKDSYVSKLFNDVFSEQFISMWDIPDFNEKSMTGGSHFNASVHERLAKLLAERYFK